METGPIFCSSSNSILPSRLPLIILFLSLKSFESCRAFRWIPFLLHFVISNDRSMGRPVSEHLAWDVTDERYTQSLDPSNSVSLKGVKKKHTFGRSLRYDSEAYYFVAIKIITSCEVRKRISIKYIFRNRWDTDNRVFIIFVF